MVRRTKEDADATRAALIDAAERVFHRRGVSRASLAEIAAEAGASRGAIYWHFQDKADLFNAMMDRVTLPLEHSLQAFEGLAYQDPVCRLRSVMELVLRSVTSDARTRRVFEIALYRVEYVEELAAVRERHLQAAQAFTDQLARDFAHAWPARQPGFDWTPLAAAVGLHALFDGLIKNWLLMPEGFDLVAVGRLSTDAYLRGLGLSLSGAVDDS